MKKLLIAAGLGLIFGTLVSKYLFGGTVLSLLPWAIAGLGIGWFANSMQESLGDGAAYGFVLTFSFMMMGYEGSASRISRILPFSALGLFGALCGLVLGITGYALARLIKKA